jgi:tryptophan synthase alpha chain
MNEKTWNQNKTMPTIGTKNRIEELFEEKKERILSVYFSAGFPELNDTSGIMKHLSQSGADIIEVGIPFSDPVADGPTIQESNKFALDNGISLKLIFEQLADIRNDVSIPIILMGYINPVLQFGIEMFCKKCAEVGVDGLILPDLPMQEYLDEYKSTFEKYGLRNIFLITPQTSESRIREIDDNSKGFIYMVSSASTTGAKMDISKEQKDYFQRIQEMNLINPTLIGFGISNRETFDQACTYASGAIIGSAFINVIRNAKNLQQDISAFIKSIKGIQ